MNLQRKMIHRNIMVLALLLTSVVLSAAPARRGRTTVVLQDGETVEAMLVGDEAGNWLQTADGRVVLNLGEGMYRYATADEVDEMRLAAQKLREENDERRALRMRKASLMSEEGDAPSYAKAQGITFDQNVGAQGNKKGVVILVNFTDRKMLSENSAEEYRRMFNEAGYSDDNHVGSLKDYFIDQSYGKLSVDFDIVGPVTVSQASTYYGQPCSSINTRDKYAATMVSEAVALADEEVDFSDYDWDGDGEVDQVLVVYAGWGANVATNSDSLIWPHEWTLASAGKYGDGAGAMTVDGVKVSTYAVVPEISGKMTAATHKRYGIGLACHEFAHCLGFRDLYDTDYSGGFGMMCWDIMDEGHYSGPDGRCERPVGMTSLERWMAGWLTPVIIDGTMHVEDMPCVGDEPVAYVVYNDAYSNEAYLFENHYYKSKWYSYVDSLDCSPSGYDINGVLALHLDYDKALWKTNKINDDKNHQRYTVVPASNSFGKASGMDFVMKGADYRGQLYGNMAKGTNTELSRTSVPATNTFTANTDGAKMLNIDLTNIRQEAATGLVAFDAYSSFMQQTCATPTIKIEKGRCRFVCATEGAKCHYEFSMASARGDCDEVADVPQLKVRVYATADGYRDSAVAEYMCTIGAGGEKGDVNEDGSVNVADISELVNIVLGR